MYNVQSSVIGSLSTALTALYPCLPTFGQQSNKHDLYFYMAHFFFPRDFLHFVFSWEINSLHNFFCHLQSKVEGWGFECFREGLDGSGVMVVHHSGALCACM